MMVVIELARTREGNDDFLIVSLVPGTVLMDSHKPGGVLQKDMFQVERGGKAMGS